MKTLLKLVLVAFGGLYFTLGFAADADVLRESQDRAAIQGLMWRYVRALDSFNGEAYAGVFTEDGQFRSGNQGITQGRAALRKMVDDLKKSREERAAKGEAVPPLNHMIPNAYIEFVDADHARYHSYWMTVIGASGPDTQPRIAASGRGVDEVVRVNGAWLIQMRDVAPGE